MEQSYFEQYNSQVVELFNKIRATLKDANEESISAKAELVPSGQPDKDKRINVVFAGQYSAGKSSLLNILTGENLEVGGGITTTKCKSLEWEGINVTDTPGIHTQGRPDHDEITYEELAKADLIVFVVTAEGFSNHLAQHFRKLINEKGKGHEMMLVVNKMDRTNLGNKPELRKILLDNDILPVIEPYTAEDMYISFISVELYNKAFMPQYEKYKSSLIAESGISDFIKNLNKFISDKHLLGAYTTSLYEVEKILSDIIESMSIGDPLADSGIHILNERRQRLENTKQKIYEKVNLEISKTTSKVKELGNDTASRFTSNLQQIEAERLLDERQQDVNNMTNVLNEAINKVIDCEVGRLSEDFENINKSEFVSNFETAYCERLQRCGKSDHTVKVIKVCGFIQTLSNKVVSMSKGKNMGEGFDAIFKTKNYSGSKLHDVIYKGTKWVTRQFGKEYKFAPWEAVGWAKKVANGARLTGLVANLFGVGLQIYSENQEDKGERQLAEAKSKIRASFNDAAHAIDLHYDKETDLWIQENINPNIADIDRDIKVINDNIQSTNELYGKLSELLMSVRNLISEIQSV